MSGNWKVSAFGPRELIQAALLRHEDAWDWDPEIILSGSEIADDKPEDWQLEVYLAHKPRKRELKAIHDLFDGSAPPLEVEKLPEADWLVLSQQGIEPIAAGHFCVRTPDHPQSGNPTLRELVIPASQAFGTGQHATTSGCLTMLTHMHRQGVSVRNLADIGTGTGLLAFAALDLWPRALATASDIDPVCIDVVAHNAALNGFALGPKPGQVTMLAAAGTGHPLLQARAPYDLLIANILAGPLIELAPAFAETTIPGGSLVLSGLLEVQEPAVRQAYLLAGFRLAARLVNGDWSILWLRRRSGGRVRATRPGAMPEWSRRW